MLSADCTGQSPEIIQHENNVKCVYFRRYKVIHGHHLINICLFYKFGIFLLTGMHRQQQQKM